jgi:hypothetical protein
MVVVLVFKNRVLRSENGPFKEGYSLRVAGGYVGDNGSLGSIIFSDWPCL